FLDPDDAGQGALRAGRVANDPNLIADDDARTAELARLRCADVAISDEHPVAAAIDGDDHADVGIGIVRAVLGTRPVAATPGTLESLVVVSLADLRHR